MVMEEEELQETQELLAEVKKCRRRDLAFLLYATLLACAVSAYSGLCWREGHRPFSVVMAALAFWNTAGAARSFHWYLYFTKVGKELSSHIAQKGMGR